MRIVMAGQTVCAQDGTYGAYPKIYQEFADHRIGGVTASIGSWMVGDRFAGLTMRESPDPIVRHASPIVPHVVRADMMTRQVARWWQAVRGVA